MTTIRPGTPEEWDTIENAYLNWWNWLLEIGGNDPIELESFTTFQRASVEQWLADFTRPVGGGREDFNPESVDEEIVLPPEDVPIPPHAKNEDYTEGQPDPDKLPEVDLDSVIVGVIDTGIGLGNARFRDEKGDTRVLAAWQQNANRKDLGMNTPLGQQRYVPFGKDLYFQDIQRLLKKHGSKTLKNYLREDDFNRDAGSVDFENLLGHRELAGRFAHGTHVLDIAAGFDPLAMGTDPDILRRMKILAVNLPHRDTYGASGTFLDYFTLFAIKRIAELSDLIWSKAWASKHDRGTDPEGVRGFPIVINLSFGKNGGPKDGRDFFNVVFREINHQRVADNRTPITLVLPMGNDNLERGSAVLDLAKGARDSLVWRTRPTDQTPNFLEIRTEPQSTEAADKYHVVAPLEIMVTPPGGIPTKAIRGKHGNHWFIGNFARLYTSIEYSKQTKTFRHFYLLCVTASERSPNSELIARPGAWTILLRNRGKKPVRVHLDVQSDQSTLPYAATGLRSYFDAPSYSRHVESGRRRDSYAYPFDPYQGGLDNSPVVRRHGSMNDTASSRDTVAVAGYRLSDGRPVDYSATGLDEVVDPDTGKIGPTLAQVTDDGAAHFGILASGAASGSVVAMRGTSFAAAATTRRIAEILLELGPQTHYDFNSLLSSETMALELADKLPPGWEAAAPLKVGAGRLQTRRPSEVDRIC